MPQLSFLGQDLTGHPLTLQREDIQDAQGKNHHQDHPHVSVHTRLSQDKHRKNSLHTELRPAQRDMRLPTLSHAAETVQGRGGGRGSQSYPAYHLSTYFLLQTPVQTGLGFGKQRGELGVIRQTQGTATNCLSVLAIMNYASSTSHSPVHLPIPKMPHNTPGLLCPPGWKHG